MPDRQTCIDCGGLSPETETNYTLISSQFGWRLTRTRLPNGTFVVEWRCPVCWKGYKQRKLAAEEARRAGRTPSPVPAPSTRPLPSFPSTIPPSSGPPPSSRRRPDLERLERPPTPGPIPPRLPRTRT